MRILAPHKDQDGYVYIRVSRLLGRWFTHKGWFPCLYLDDQPDQRIISSRRVEEDVETGDYLKRCSDEGLDVRYWSACYTGVWWIVWEPTKKRAMPAGSPTLREAYHRYVNGESR